ncbi:MAG TPA: nucleotidyltransferase family protein, partial [Acidimicrobiales bacterium]|nr:nucleotidyltransferase family protein [Acidimicrobiales bacterium]
LPALTRTVTARGFPSDGLVRTAHKLRVDLWTAEVVGALRERGVRAVLLKGPALAGWLYADDPSARAYADVDLLVGPGDRQAAEDVLGGLGFREPSARLGREWKFHADLWRRDRDGALVDLHRTLHGMEELSPSRVWQVVAEDTETRPVGGCPVEIPNVVVRTLHVGLHLDIEDRPGSQAWTDLDRALDRVDRLTWRRAAELAGRLGIRAEMGERLRMHPGGAALARDLGLPSGGSQRFRLQVAVASNGAPPQICSLHQLASLRGRRAKAGYLFRKLFPPPVFMRQRSRLASGGGWRLAIAYPVRAVWCAAVVPRAFWGWRRASFPKGQR